MTMDKRIAPALAATFEDIGQQLAAALPDGAGFALLIFDLDNPGGRMNYYSNAERGGMIAALKELIAFMEGNVHGSKSIH